MSQLVELGKAIFNRNFHLNRWMNDVKEKEYQNNFVRADDHYQGTLVMELQNLHKRINALEYQLKSVQKQQRAGVR